MPLIDVDDSTIRMINWLKTKMEEFAIQAGISTPNITLDKLIQNSVALRLYSLEDEKLAGLISDYWGTRDGITSILKLRKKYGFDEELGLK